MTQAQAIRIATRCIAVYLICWAISDAIELPRQIFNFVTAYRMAAELHDTAFPKATENFYVNGALQWVVQSVLRIALWLAGALWFYRCGPRLQRFFGGADTSVTDEPEGPQ